MWNLRCHCKKNDQETDGVHSVGEPRPLWSTHFERNSFIGGNTGLKGLNQWLATDNSMTDNILGQCGGKNDMTSHFFVGFYWLWLIMVFSWLMVSLSINLLEYAIPATATGWKMWMIGTYVKKWEVNTSHNNMESLLLPLDSDSRSCGYSEGESIP